MDDRAGTISSYRTRHREGLQVATLRHVVHYPSIPPAPDEALEKHKDDAATQYGDTRQTLLANALPHISRKSKVKKQKQNSQAEDEDELAVLDMQKRHDDILDSLKTSPWQKNKSKFWDVDPLPGTSTLEQTVNTVNTNVQNLIKAIDKETTYTYEQLTAYSEMSKLATLLD